MKVYVVYTVIIGDRYDFEDAEGCEVFSDYSDAERYKEEITFGNYAKIVEKVVH
jgi:hypothetical protein